MDTGDGPAPAADPLIGDGFEGIALKLAILVACLAVSAFFSAAETSIVSVSKIRVRTLAEDGSKKGQALAALHDRLEQSLHAILVGNNIVNTLAASIATSIVMGIVKGGIAIGIATVAVTFLILIFGEITPKTASVRNTERIALALARPALAVKAVLSPVVWVLNKATAFIMSFGGKKSDQPLTFTEQELMDMVEVSHEEGVLRVDEKQMLHNVFEFGDGEVREVMTPRIHVVSVSADDDYATVMGKFKEHTYSRLPVTSESSDEIVGIVNLKDIALSENRSDAFSLSDYLRPPHFVYEFNNAAKVFSDMRKERSPFAVVLDEYGVMVGVITTEDFIEEIVGDINDEYDDTDTGIHPIADSEEYRVDGAVSIDEFNEALGSTIETDDFDSIGGFVLGLLEDFPTEGDTVSCEGVGFVVESVKNNRIDTLRVKIAKPLEQDDDAEKGDSRNENRGNGKPDGKSDGRPDSKADGKSDGRADGKPGDKYDGRADGRPGDKHDGKTGVGRRQG